ncbi:MAG TPA: hypothetical protein VF265_07660 [Nevskiaceae bacterium]
MKSRKPFHAKTRLASVGRDVEPVTKKQYQELVHMRHEAEEASYEHTLKFKKSRRKANAAHSPGDA